MGASNTVRRGSSTPNASRTCATTRVASSECPPNSKKSSRTPTCSSFSTSAQIPANACSVGVRAATYCPTSGRPSGAGNRPRSIFPLPVNGNSGSTTNAVGTIYSGRVRLSCSRSWAGCNACPASATT